MTDPLSVTFSAGASGEWAIARITAVTGESLATAARLAVTEGAAAPSQVAALAGATLPNPTTDAPGWLLHGVASNQR